MVEDQLSAGVLKLGTSVDPDNPIRPSLATAYVLDMTQPSRLRSTGALRSGRCVGTVLFLISFCRPVLMVITDNQISIIRTY